MATFSEFKPSRTIGISDFQRRWYLFILLGLALVILGTIAIATAVASTLISVLFFGCLLFAAGMVQVVHALVSRRWGGHILDLVMGLLSCTAGLTIVANPGAAAAAITLLVAALLIMGGVIRVGIALAVPFHHQVWVVAHGIIGLLLGLLILLQWPLSGQWVIGFFIGIDMIFNGWTLIVLGLVSRQLPAS